MAGKLSAIGSECYIGTADLSGDVGAVTEADTSRAPIDVTAINKGAPERIPGRRDGSMKFAAFFNADTGAIHDTLSAMPTTDVLATVALGTPALGGPAASMLAKQLNYALAVGADGSLGVSFDMAANGWGLEWGELLTTGQQTFATGTVDGTAIDLGSVSTAFGASAYLHVISHGSGTATFTIQDSDDNLSFTAVSGLAFTAVTAATTQRVQIGLTDTVRQYVRIHKTGTSTATVAVVNFVRYFDTGPA